MSNYSEWQLAFLGSKDKVKKVEKLLNTIANDKKRTTIERTLASVILNNRIVVAEKPEENLRAIVYAHSNTKCDDSWNSVIAELMTTARDKLNIKASYARLGDEMSDYQFDCDKDLGISYRRYLTEINL